MVEPLSVHDVTPQMVSAGVAALLSIVPADVAFPFGREEEAVRAILLASLEASSQPRRGR
jgi:hypothetical protein